MLVEILNRHLLQPLAAAKNGSRHLVHLRHLRKTQFDPPDAIRGQQLERLKETLRHACETVPYYARVWKAAGVHPNDIRTLDDLKHFPVLTKADIRSNETDL